MDVRMCTMKPPFCSWLWYVDIIDQFCGMLENADWVIFCGRVSSMDYPTKTTDFLNISDYIHLASESH